MTDAAQELDRAGVLLDLGRHAEAASLLARFVAVEPENSRAWCLFTATHLAVDRYEQAAAAAGRAIALAPSDDWAHRLASVAQRRLGNVTAAVSSASEACKRAPQEWRAYICLAQAQLAAGTDLAAAERAAANALQLAPDEPDAHFTAGQISYARGRWRDARAQQQRALALDPTHSGALNELGLINLHHGPQSRAAWHFAQAARWAPGVSDYGRNAEEPVRRILALTVNAVYLATLALLILTLETHVPRLAVVLGYALVGLLIAGYGAVQLWLMPSVLHVLFRAHRVGLALGAIYGAVIVELVAAAVTPTRYLYAAMPAATAVVAASALIARAIMRRASANSNASAP